MATEKKKLPGGVTAAQMDAWKKEGPVHIVEVEINDGKEKVVGYFREPNRTEYGTAAQIFQKSSPLAVGEFLLNNCKLGGDERIWTVDKIYMSAAIAAQELIDFFPARISRA